jgi:hypothetical protein
MASLTRVDSIDITHDTQILKDVINGMLATNAALVAEVLRLSRNKLVNSVVDLFELVGTARGDIVTTTEYRPTTGFGYGTYRWEPDMPKAKHNGGTVIDPDKVFPTTWNKVNANSWYAPSASVDNGVWLRQQEAGYYMVEWFGAVPYVIGGTQDSTWAFQQTVNAAGEGGAWKWRGRHRTTASVEVLQRQDFGSFGTARSVSTSLFNPANFQGVHTATGTNADKIDSALFYDNVTGSAFFVHEAAHAHDFTLYSNAITARGVNLEQGLPKDYLPVSAFKHRKYMTSSNVTVVLFQWAFDSSSWFVPDAGAGDYYTKIHMSEALYCRHGFRQSGTVSYNTKVSQCRFYVNSLADNSNTKRDFAIYMSSVEGYNIACNLRAGFNWTISGCYFETFDATFTDPVFQLIGAGVVNIENNLIYLNKTSWFVSSGGAGQGAGVGHLVLNSKGNELRNGDTAAAGYLNITSVPTKKGVIGGDKVIQAPGTINYFTGSASDFRYDAPMVITG